MPHCPLEAGEEDEAPALGQILLQKPGVHIGTEGLTRGLDVLDKELRGLEEHSLAGDSVGVRQVLSSLEAKCTSSHSHVTGLLQQGENQLQAGGLARQL